VVERSLRARPGMQSRGSRQRPREREWRKIDGALAIDHVLADSLTEVTSVKLVEIRVRREVAIGQAARGGIWIGSAVSVAASSAMVNGAD
jgi:hypothetical protein